MNKKLKTLLSLGVVSVVTASTALPINAMKKLNDCNITTNRYLCIDTKAEMPTYLELISDIVNNLCNKNNTIKENNKKNKLVNIQNEKNDKNTSKVEKNNEAKNNVDKKSDKKEINKENNNIKNNENQNNNVNTNTDVNTNTEVKNTEKPIVTGNFSQFQQQVLELVNAERSKAGLNSLKFNSELSNVATSKSQDMIDKNYFDHNSPTYGSPFDMMKKFGVSYRSAGENIAMGQSTPAEVMNGWMNSPGHRANILNSSFTEIGIGIAKKSNGSIYWTQMFIGK